MVVRIKYEGEMGQNMRMLVCRDAFPKEYLPEARTLAQKGKALRRACQFHGGCQGHKMFLSWRSRVKKRLAIGWTAARQGCRETRGELR
jgi:hypothetical protein